MRGFNTQGTATTIATVCYRFAVHRMVLRHDLIYGLLLMNEMSLTVWFGHQLWSQAIWGQTLELRRRMTLATDCSLGASVSHL